MPDYHILLQEQLKQYFGKESNIPEDLCDFIEAVNNTYQLFERECDKNESRIVKQSRDQLRESEEKLQLIFENAFDGISIHEENLEDRTRRLVECNQSYADMAGRSKQELLDIGNTLSIQRHIETNQEINVLDSNELITLKNNKIYSGMFSWIRPDGKENIIEFSAVPVTLNGKILTIGLDRDITERNQAEESLKRIREELEIRVAERTKELKETNQQLQEEIAERKHMEEERTKLENHVRQMQKMESVGLLAGGIAHDFNNLLTPIIGYCDLILSDANIEESIHDSLQNILSAADRARELTNQLLAFSRKQVLELKVINIYDVARSFLPILRRTIREDIDIKISNLVNEPLVLADIGQIEQVLLNLALNSQDAITGAGSLNFKIEEISIDQKYSDFHPSIKTGMYICIEVSDTGSGMKKEVLEHLFEPFFTTKAQGKGTGLGLSMVYGIIQQHSGSITVYSEIDKGTTFRIYLPCSPVKTAEPDLFNVISKDEAAEGGKEAVFVVEDNVMVKDLVCKILKNLGYDVLSADSPKNCFSLLEKTEKKIDLLLTDVILPEMDGKELYTRIKKMHKGIKVLFMSGYSNDVISHHGILDDSICFIQKPFSREQLAKKIRLALSNPDD